MDESLQLPDTQTPKEIPTSQNSQEICKPWGRLSACSPNLSSFDLFESNYTCGRAPYCNIVIKDNVPSFPNISKTHFELSKEDDLVYLIDYSKNGTFVNSQKVGKNQRFIINTNDVIALGQPNIKAFIFNFNSNFDEGFLPQTMRKDYFVSRVLGRGACGEVRYALNRKTSTEYAIKRILKAGSSSNSCKINHPQKIQTEIKILKTLTHPFIIQMKEVYESEREVFLVLEYMKGGDLGGRILSIVPLPESEVKFIFYQMLLATEYLHQHGITHRDLKPENVLLMSDGQYPMIKIADFGLSKIMDEKSLMETICGTINYVAPEILTREERYTKKVDVWSLGVILYYMLSKKLPFMDTDREHVARKILKGKYDFAGNWKAISATAKDLVRKMLTRDPNCRISINDILQHPWIERDITMQYRVKQLTENCSENEKSNSSDLLIAPPVKRARYSN